MKRLSRFVLLACIIFVAQPTLAQDSLNVRRVGQVEFAGPVYAVAVQDRYAFVTDFGGSGGGRLSVVDIADPDSPVYVSELTLQRHAMDVVVSGDYAYVAESTDGLVIVNVSNPAALTWAGAYDTPGTTYSVVVRGNYAYITEKRLSYGGRSGLGIINISNPAAPVLTGFCDTQSYRVFRVAISGNYAYMAEEGNGMGESGVRIINISNPAAPAQAGFFPTSTDVAYGVAASGNYAYVTAGMYLKIVNISNPAAPTEVGSYELPWTGLGVTLSGNYAYVGDEHRGLQIVDISNPAAPVVTGFYYGPPSRAWKVVVNGATAYVADYCCLSIYDCSAAAGTPAPHAPQPSAFSLSSYPNPFNATARLSFALPQTAPVSLEVFDVEGRLVETLASRIFPAGEHHVTFDGSDLASGMYLVRLESGSRSMTQKLLLLK